MQENEHNDGDERAAAEAQSCGILVVLSPVLGPIARTKLWRKSTAEGYEILVITRLHVEQHAALNIISGASPAKLFENCCLVTPHWTEKNVGYVGGQWMFHKNARSEFHGVGFVLGSADFNIERAVKGSAQLLTETYALCML